jgi:ABC-2 type transport system permease protein
VNIVVYSFWVAIKNRLGFGRAFLYECIAQTAWFVLDAAGFWVILSRFGSIGGWSAGEVFLLFAVGAVVWGIGGGFFSRGNYAVGWCFDSGFIDIGLSKPYNFYAAFMSGNVNPSHFPRILLAIALLVVCAVRFVGPVPAPRVLLFVVGMLGGMLICAALNTLCGALGFRLARGESTMWLISTLSRVISYPAHIFPRVLQVTVTFVVPFALATYYPTRWLVRGDVPGGGWLMPATFALGLALFYGAYKLWMSGLRHYQSTGN